MKKIIFFLVYYVLLIGSPNSKADTAVDTIKQELEKCELSISTSILSDINECLNIDENLDNKIDIHTRIKAVIGLAMCVKIDLKQIPNCINELSTYILDVEDAKYKSLLICSPVTQIISSFEDLEDIDPDEPILSCRKPFSNDPENIEEILTKNDFIEYIFSSNRKFILIDRRLIFYSVKQLEMYFEYIEMLYEEKS